MGEKFENGRAWCFVFQYPGKQMCMFASVYCRLGATHQEVEAECRRTWATIFPFELPPLVQLVPGTLVFMPESPAQNKPDP